jgi:hypothetical protein
VQSAPIALLGRVAVLVTLAVMGEGEPPPQNASRVVAIAGRLTCARKFSGGGRQAQTRAGVPSCATRVVKTVVAGGSRCGEKAFVMGRWMFTRENGR